ncbi:hypothetical protein WCU84_06960 [Dickeya chrysanthemi]|uniref:Uncharacterized protein n=1 Tax=Dickeya chrysanthemi TaxID=556 RepID=A0ABU8JIX7_DICCH
MLHSLRHAADRGAHIVAFNTLRERGLERIAIVLLKKALKAR